MNIARRFMAGAVWTVICNAYQRFVISVATPAITHVRTQLIQMSGSDAKQPIFVDMLLLVLAIAVFLWTCQLMRENRIFQWLYQIASFGLFGYFALFTWQVLLFLAVLFAETYPEYLDAVQRTLFEYISALLLAPSDAPVDSGVGDSAVE